MDGFGWIHSGWGGVCLAKARVCDVLWENLGTTSHALGKVCVEFGGLGETITLFTCEATKGVGSSNENYLANRDGQKWHVTNDLTSL